MKIALAIILVICIAGLVFTYYLYSTAQNELQYVKATLQQTQLEQRETEKILEESREDLQETEAILEETAQELEDQQTQTDIYTQLYDDKTAELEDKEKELDTLTVEVGSLKSKTSELEASLEEIQDKLDLYEDTLGTKVFSGVMPPYYSGSLDIITLINRDTAENPTWNELLAFLQTDKTDKKLYIPNIYVCGSFAQEVHNNAESAGIRAAFVVVHFKNSTESHAINAFKTLDRGLVYIDCTGYTSTLGITNNDRLVEMAKDEIFTETPLFPEGWMLLPGEDIVERIEIYW